MGDADVGDVDVEAQGRHRRTRARLTDDDRARPSRTFAGQDSGIADDVVLGAVEDVVEQEVRRRGAHGAAGDASGDGIHRIDGVREVVVDGLTAFTATRGERLADDGYA